MPNASLERAVTFNKNDPAALETLGSVYAAEQHYRRCARAVRGCFRAESEGHVAAFPNRRRRTRNKTIFRWRCRAIGRVLAIDPRNIQALVFKADLYARQHDDAHATAAYDDAVVAAPTDDQKVAIMVRKAGYFIQEKKDAQGLAILQQVTTQFPKIPAGFVAFGDYYASQQQIRQGHHAMASRAWRSIPIVRAH